MTIAFAPVMPSAAHDSKVHERKAEANQRLATLGNSEADATHSDRDADGRQAWQWHQQQRKKNDAPERRPQDISGKIGTTLDLDG